MTSGLSLDDIVSVAVIVEAVVQRPLSPTESARLKAAWAGGRGLVEMSAVLDGSQRAV